MASPPASPSPRPRRGARSYLREKYHKIVQSHSRSLSRQSLTGEASASSAHLASPLPNHGQGSSSTLGNLLAPPSASSPVVSRHTHNLILGLKDMGWATGLRTALEELHKVARVFPPLESAIGSLVSVLGLLEVCFCVCSRS